MRTLKLFGICAWLGAVHGRAFGGHLSCRNWRYLCRWDSGSNLLLHASLLTVKHGSAA
jgi:hypothetical protein